MTPKFEGWCSVEEYEKWTAELDEQDKEAIRQYWEWKHQERPGMYISGWKLLRFFGNVLLFTSLLGGLVWFAYQLIMALPRFIEAWR